MSRLRALYVANNQITRIAADFFDAIPELSQRPGLCVLAVAESYLHTVLYYIR